MLDIHPASASERLAAYHNVHDVWSAGLDLESHVQRRLKSVQHNRADWFVGCVDGEVVTSLAVYPLKFHFRGRIVPGFSIGSVHTLAKARGKGFASQLIRWVEEYQAAAGAELSMLYSDIPPEYYARLCYQACPAWSASVDTSAIGERKTGFRLQQFDPRQEINLLRSLYDDEHSRYEISIARDAEYWGYLLVKESADEFHWVVDEAGTNIGYVRLRIGEEGAKLRDFARVGKRLYLSTLLETLAAFLAKRGISTLFGWLPNSIDRGSDVQLEERPAEITMVKMLAEDVELTDSECAAAMHFREIDHV
jgi:predicted N-acetyltransferase YhbS